MKVHLKSRRTRVLLGLMTSLLVVTLLIMPEPFLSLVVPRSRVCEPTMSYNPDGIRRLCWSSNTFVLYMPQQIFATYDGVHPIERCDDPAQGNLEHPGCFK